jgi:outer membrane protein assembly factor BamD (BamD/ComL family)
MITRALAFALLLVAAMSCQVLSDDLEDFNQIDRLYRDGKFEEALGSASRFLKQYPQSPLLPNVLYKAGRLSRDVAAALDLFSQVVVKYPGSSVVDNALFMIAQYHYASGSYGKAQARFQFIVENYKTSDISDAGHWWLSRSYGALGDTVMARVWENKLVQKYPNSEYTRIAGSKVPESISNVAYRFTVQVGSFESRDAATALSSSLANKGYGAYVTMSESSGKVLYKVRVGSFLSREEASGMVKTLKEVEGLSSWITPKE